MARGHKLFVPDDTPTDRAINGVQLFILKHRDDVADDGREATLTFHGLRHSAATNLLDLGFNVVQVAEWLGHESPNTTLKFYGHAIKTSKMEMANALDKVLENC